MGISDVPELERFVDKFGFVVHGHQELPYDGGDSAQRTMTVFIYNYITDPQMRIFHAQKLVTALRLIKRPSGEYVRHPDPNYWWGQTRCMSWDNLIGIIICLNLYCRYSDELRKMRSDLFWKLVLRLGFTWNTLPIWPTEEEKQKWKVPGNAFLHPGTWLAFLRGVRFPFNLLVWPLVFAIDLTFLIETIAMIIASFVKPDDPGPHLNYQLNLIHSQIQNPTGIGWFCKQLYGALLFNPIDPRTKEIMKGYAPYNIWEAYFWNLNTHPPMYLLTHRLTKKYL